jgi:hypothetical protein
MSTANKPTRTTPSKVPLEPYDCSVCELKFYRLPVSAGGVAFAQPVCFECYTTQVTQEKDVSAIAFRFADERVRHAYRIGFIWTIVREDADLGYVAERWDRKDFEQAFL